MPLEVLVQQAQQAAQSQRAKVDPATKDYGPKPKYTNPETSYSGTTSYGPSYAHLDKHANKACQTVSPTPTLSNSEDNKDNKEIKVSKDNRASKVQLVYVVQQARKVFKANREFKENAGKQVNKVQLVQQVALVSLIIGATATGATGATGETGERGKGVWEGLWKEDKTYYEGDHVKWNNLPYVLICTPGTNCIQGQPGMDNDWLLLQKAGEQGEQGSEGAIGAQGIQGIQGLQGRSSFQGTWKDSIEYHEGDIVTYDEIAYQLICPEGIACRNDAPTSPTMATTRHQGEQGAGKP